MFRRNFLNLSKYALSLKTIKIYKRREIEVLVFDYYSSCYNTGLDMSISSNISI